MEQATKEMLWDAVKSADSIAIGGHVQPDGDCVGSTMGMYHYITRNFPGKKVQVYLGNYAKEFDFLPGLENAVHCVTPEETGRAVNEASVYDLFIACDTSSLDRLEFRGIFEKARHNFVLDHHVTNPGYGEANIILDSSSASETVFDQMDYDLIDQNCAQAIYMGIVHDTGVFRFDCCTRHTMEVAGSLIDKGVDTQFIIDDTFFKKSYRANVVMGRCLASCRLYDEGRIIAGVTTLDDFTELQAGKPDTEGIVDQLRITDGVKAAIYMYQTDGGHFKVSLRSNDDLDVSRVALRFGGGGHVKAAGCTVGSGVYEQALTQILDCIHDEIEKQGITSWTE